MKDEDFRRLEFKVDQIMDFFHIGKESPLSPSDTDKYVGNLVIKLEERRRKREAGNVGHTNKNQRQGSRG